MNKRFSNASSRECAPEDDDETAAMVTSGNDEEQQHQGEEEEEELKPSSRGAAAQCQQQKKRTSKTGEAEEEEGEELIQQEDDLQSVESQNENCRADFCLDRHDHQQNGNAADDDEGCDQEKLKLIEQQETPAEAPLEGKGRPRPAMLQIHHTVQPYQSAEKVKSPPPNAAADEAFLGQMREKKKVAGLIARFNAFAPTAATAANNENAAAGGGGGGSNSKKIGGAEPGKVGELRQKFN
ncbi:hypothetical protein niasHT_035216 [Heterodera trifolii]|uniref:Uncharacterized protein n=1 Tax=Heterodera trifolii TaxID=157864 RepID=A0ABD2IIR1_9BILA